MRDSWSAMKPLVRSNGGHGRLPPRVGTAVFLFLVVVLFYLLLPDHRKPLGSGGKRGYPFTLAKSVEGGLQYRIAVISDLDKKSKSESESHLWLSYMKTGWLVLLDSGGMRVHFDQDVTLTSHLSEKGRATELSELVVFNDRLYTVDDRTGIVYEVTDEHKLIPFVIMRNGDGRQPDAFKAEWMTVKDNHLYVGGLGKDWTTVDGIVLNRNPKWVKVISPDGAMRHENWTAHYNKIQQATGIKDPGYIIHEAVVWSSIHRRWYFLPRRASTGRYNEKDDERQATNLLISCREDFADVRVSHLGELDRTHGFSSFKFVPGTHDDVIVALKSEEDGARSASYILGYKLDGQMIMAEKKLADAKFEGIEFI